MFRSFLRGVVSLCRSKGCKVSVCQILKINLLPGRVSNPSCMHVGLAAKQQNIFSSIHLWQHVNLQPFDPQIFTVPLWKNLKHLKNILLTDKNGRIFKIGFSLSKWPHLHRAFYVREWRVMIMTVCTFFVRSCSIANDLSPLWLFSWSVITWANS